jgi:hypothetical protein
MEGVVGSGRWQDDLYDLLRRSSPSTGGTRFRP